MIPSYLEKVYKTLDIKTDKGTYDSSVMRGHSIDSIQEVQNIQYEEVQARMAVSGEHFQSLSEMKEDIRMTMDGFINPMTGIGTGKDPGGFNSATIPLTLSPFEATSLYASGGLPEIIINKKSKGILLNGYNFTSTNSDVWTHDRLKQLKEASDQTNAEEALSEGTRDGLIYGGSLLYPTLKGDSAASYDYSLKELLNSKLLVKGCINHFSVADRWNTVIVPNYNITSEHYLSAERLYVPISGISVNAHRSAMLRPKKLPYWGALRQLGWSVSDYEGYMRSIYAYEIMIASIPIMAQQMSLLMYEMPLEGMLATMGITEAKEFMKLNDESMRDWSMANPKTINALGKVYAVNRTYTGYADLGQMLRQDLGAQTGIPEAALFQEQSKGFSDNTAEILLKQSETVRLTQKTISPSLINFKNILVANAFGQDSEEWKNRDSVHFTFDNPVIATEAERAEAAARFAATVNSLRQAGMPLQQALTLASQFFKTIELDSSVILASAERDEQKTKIEQETHNADMAKAAVDLETAKKALTEKPAEKNIFGQPKKVKEAKDE